MISLEMWENLVIAGYFYRNIGYRDLPQPWTVSHRATHATLPAGAVPTMLHGGEDLLLGSAEQAFIDRMLEGSMKPGKWQAITPCFRREPVVDLLHRPYFMKLELVDYMPVDPDDALQRMIADAYLSFGNLVRRTGPHLKVEYEQTELGWDLTLRGKEIGSYGIREFEGHRWVYGTGLAEPRFTTLMERCDLF